MRNFRTLDIWNNGIDNVELIYSVTREFPDYKRFGLASQMQRAAVSIPSNIAEGCSRSSDVEYKRFLEIAMGSAFELETQLILCLRLDYISQLQYDEILSPLHLEQKQINALISKIKEGK